MRGPGEVEGEEPKEGVVGKRGLLLLHLLLLLLLFSGGYIDAIRLPLGRPRPPSFPSCCSTHTTTNSSSGSCGAGMS